MLRLKALAFLAVTLATCAAPATAGLGSPVCTETAPCVIHCPTPLNFALPRYTVCAPH